MKPGEGAAQAAYRQLIVHGASCPTCLTVDETGKNANLPCGTGARAYAEYRRARRSS